MPISSLGRVLLGVGAVLMLAGVVLVSLGRFPLLGHLPGDLRFRGRNWTVSVPLATSLLLSLLLTLLFWLFGRLR